MSSKLNMQWYSGVQKVLAPSTIKTMLSLDPALETLSPSLVKAMDWDFRKAELEEQLSRMEYTWSARVVEGVPILRGCRDTGDGGWTTWCVIPTSVGGWSAYSPLQTIDEDRAWQLAERHGRVDQDHRYSHPGGPYQNPGWMRKTNTRYLFVQSGGLDI